MKISERGALRLFTSVYESWTSMVRKWRGCFNMVLRGRRHVALFFPLACVAWIAACSPDARHLGAAVTRIIDQYRPIRVRAAYRPTGIIEGQYQTNQNQRRHVGILSLLSDPTAPFLSTFHGASTEGRRYTRRLLRAATLRRPIPSPFFGGQGAEHIQSPREIDASLGAWGWIASRGACRAGASTGFLRPPTRFR
jgi:hypothetical protein